MKGDIGSGAQDTNFDDLASHFKQRIYGSRKGAMRLAVLQRDLQENVPELAALPKTAEKRLKILDIGAGMAQISLALAKQGHDVLVNDISANMLKLAQDEAEKQGVASNVEWSHQPFQTLEAQQCDVILCHAVLEWLETPEVLLQHLQRHLKPQGVVSLMFYNKDALLYHNLIRGNFNKSNNNDYSGMKGGLTPPNPLHAAWVEKKLSECDLSVTSRSGVRVFSDYVGVKRGGNADEGAVLEMELRYSKQQPYVNMGRYIHFVCKRKGSK